MSTKNGLWFSWVMLGLMHLPAWASSGTLFNVIATGVPAQVNITLCLNGQGPLSCQSYDVSALDLSITTTIANHTYPNAGIKINTAGYAAENCTPIANGYCLFSVSDSAAQSITLLDQSTTLAVSTTGIIPVQNGAGTITVTNTGQNTAQNIAARLPSEWRAVNQDSHNCLSLAPGQSCQLSFSSTLPYVAAGNIIITGTHVAAPVSTALAFSLNGYLVYGLASGSTAQVVASRDATDTLGINWGNGASFSGITETSTTPCAGGTDGACNSGVIVDYYEANSTPTSAYAAGLCYQITSDNTGSVPAGTWFLPAICQLNSNANSDGSDSGSGCSLSTPSVYTNLVNLGFLTDLATGGSSDSPGNYWASTSFSSDLNDAWVQNFGGQNNAFTAPNSDFPLGVRCVRTLSY